MIVIIIIIIIIIIILASQARAINVYRKTFSFPPSTMYEHFISSYKETADA